MKSDRSEKSNGHVPEKEPLVKNGIEFETTLKQSVTGYIPNGIHTLDEHDGSSYSSVFESENEEKPKESVSESDPICPPEETVGPSGTQKEPNASSLANSQVLCDDVAESDTTLSLSKSDSTASLQSNDAFEATTLGRADSLVSVQSEDAQEHVRKSTYSLHIDCLDSLPDEKEAEIEPEVDVLVIEDSAWVDMLLLEEQQTCSMFDDKRISMHFGNLDGISEDRVSLDDISDPGTTDEKSDIQRTSCHIVNRRIEFEVEELPKIDDDEIIQCGRSGSPDKKRTETSLRVSPLIPQFICRNIVQCNFNPTPLHVIYKSIIQNLCSTSSLHILPCSSLHVPLKCFQYD